MENRIIGSHASQKCTLQLNTVQHSLINSSHINILFQDFKENWQLGVISGCVSERLFFLNSTGHRQNEIFKQQHTLAQHHFESLQRFMKM